MKSNPILEKIAQEQVELFHRDNQVYIDSLINKPALRFIMKIVYGYMVSVGRFCSVEKTSEDKRDVLWRECEYLADGTLNERGLSELRKSLYTLTSLL